MRSRDETVDGYSLLPITSDNLPRWRETLPDGFLIKDTDFNKISGFFAANSQGQTQAVGLHSSYETLRDSVPCCNISVFGAPEAPRALARILLQNIVRLLEREKAPCLALAFCGGDQWMEADILIRHGFAPLDTMAEYRASLPLAAAAERRKRRPCHDLILTYDPSAHSQWAEPLADHYNQIYAALKQPLPKRTVSFLREMRDKHSMTLIFSIDDTGEITGQAETAHVPGSTVVYGGSIIVGRRRVGTDLVHRLIRLSSEDAVGKGAAEFHAHVSTWNRASSNILETFGFRKHRELFSRFTRRIG